MTHHPITLKRWHPLQLAANRLAGPTTVTFDDEPPASSMLVDMDPRMASHRNLVTLHRAAVVNGLDDRLFEPNPTLREQPWYNRLPRIVAMDTWAIVNDETMDFTWTNDASWKDESLQAMLAALKGCDPTDIESRTTSEIGDNAVADYIVVRILARTEQETQTRSLRTDFGIGTEFQTRPDSAGILVTRDWKRGVDALANLIAEAIFEYDREQSHDSDEAQWTRFRTGAGIIAAKLLLNEHEAAAENIRRAARAHLHGLLPDDRTVELRKKPAPPGERTPDVKVVIRRDDQPQANR